MTNFCRVTFVLLLLGFVISHLITAVGITLLSGKTFSLIYPFSLATKYLQFITQLPFQRLNTHQISWQFHFFFWFYAITTTIPVGIYQIFLDGNSFSGNSRKTKYGFAKFASSSMIKKMGLNFDDGIVFGVVRKNFWQKIIAPKRKIIRSNQPLSTMIIAPTGTGKTAGFIIPTLKSLSNSAVIFDIKGELFAKTSQDRINLGQKVLVMDIDGGNIQFNPFARNQLPQDSKKLKSYIKNISNILFDNAAGSESSKKGSNYFTNSARELFNTIALHLIVKDGYTTITRIKELLLSGKDSRTIFVKIAEKISDEQEVENDKNRKRLMEQVKEGMNQIIQISEAKDQFLGVVGSLTTILSAYDDLEIKDIIDCENSTVVAADLRKEKITIYLRIKDIDLERLRPLITLFFETFVTTIISTEPTAEDNQITLILDEFGNLGKVSKLIKATTISRGYKLNQVFILQDLAQIASIYSEDERAILEANTAYKVILQQNNYDTAKRISDIIGSKTDDRISRSTKEAKSANNNDSISVSQEGINLVSPQKILNLHRDQCLIVVQGFAANVILADIAWWFKYKF